MAPSSRRPPTPGPVPNRSSVASGWVGPDQAGRLDRAMRRLFPDWARADVEAAIGQRRVKVNGTTVWLSSWQVVSGDHLEVSAPPDDKESGPTAWDPAWLVHDDGEMVVLDKPAGLRSEGVRPGDRSPNLHAFAEEGVGGRLALAHRLDRDTSGLVVLTRPGPLRVELVLAWADHRVTKTYVALVAGPGAKAMASLGQGSIRSRVSRDARRRDRMVIVERGGDLAITEWRAAPSDSRALRLELTPRSGRTHQLRVQLADEQAPILGDRLYGGLRHPRLALHASRLAFPALAGRSPMVVESPAPF